MSNSTMTELTEDQLFNMSDEELEAMVIDSRANEVIEEQNPTEQSEVVVEENLEQPDVDSDDDLTTEEAEEEKVDEESETEEDTPDEEPLEDDDQTEETEPETEESVEKVPNELDKFMSAESIVKANGKEFKFTNKEKIEAFDKLYPQAMDYTKKTQAIKPWRKTIDALEQAELGHDDINLMIDVLKGNKEAIAQVLKRTGVDTLDLVEDVSSTYKPNDYGRNADALDVKDVIDSISSDKEYETTSRILSNEWDNESFEKMTSNPTLITALHTDVKNGVYKDIQIIADKMKVLSGPNSGTSDLDFYIKAAGQYDLEQIRKENVLKAQRQGETQKELDTKEAEKVSKVKAKQAKTTNTKKAASKRKAAAPAKSNAGASSSITDYLDDSDEAYEEWYNKLQEQY